MKAPRPNNEEERIEVLRRYGILDTPSEVEFDDLTQLAARLCEAPLAGLSFIDTDREWVKSSFGLEIPEMVRDTSFSAHAILEKEVFLVEDASADERFADHPLVKGETAVEPGLPESFNVLVRELQSLCLDVELHSDRADVTGASTV